MKEYRGEISGHVQEWLQMRDERACIYLGNLLSSLRYRIWRISGGRHHDGVDG